MRIGFVQHLTIETVVKLRHIGIQLNELQIIGGEDGAANSGIALYIGIFPVGITASITICRILKDSRENHWLILLKKLADCGHLSFRCDLLNILLCRLRTGYSLRRFFNSFDLFLLRSEQIEC